MDTIHDTADDPKTEKGLKIKLSKVLQHLERGHYELTGAASMLMEVINCDIDNIHQVETQSLINIIDSMVTTRAAYTPIVEQWSNKNESE